MVRLLLDHYGLDYELVDVGNVADADAAMFGDNPLMKVPVLRDGDVFLIESDHIAAHIVRRHDPADRFGVLTTAPDALNMRAVLNGVMAEGVKIILAERTGLHTENLPVFQKARTGVENGLRWLEARSDQLDPAHAGYAEFHFVSMWDHLRRYALVPLDYPKLAAIAASLGAQETIARSAPQ